MFDLRKHFLDSGASVIEVDTGEVKVSRTREVLCARALGSCIAVIAYDPVKRLGGIAHVMLPGRSGKGANPEKSKYAEDAIDELLEILALSGSKRSDLKINLIGGADMLGEGNIHILVKASVLSYLKALKLAPEARRLGGACARSAWLDSGSGDVYFKEQDDAAEKLI